MLGRMLLSASRSSRVRRVVTAAPAGRAAVARFVAGESPGEAVGAIRRLVADGLAVTVDHVGEDISEAGQAADNRDAYLTLLRLLADEGLGAGADVSVKLSALGQALAADGDKLALEHARTICAAATGAGATVTLDMEDHTTTDSTLSILGALRVDFPSVGVAIQAYLRRSVGDCRDLARPGSRVRLCKGAYREPASVAYLRRPEVEQAYLRALEILMAGPGYPMVATHSPRLIGAAAELVRRHDRLADSYEYQMLYGVRPVEQRRLAAAGQRMRVYLPFGTDWYGYFMRRLAERPANTRFLIRSLATRS